MERSRGKKVLENKYVREGYAFLQLFQGMCNRITLLVNVCSLRIRFSDHKHVLAKYSSQNSPNTIDACKV
jgi:hypothetical protein